MGMEVRSFLDDVVRLRSGDSEVLWLVLLVLIMVCIVFMAMHVLRGHVMVVRELIVVGNHHRLVDNSVRNRSGVVEVSGSNLGVARLALWRLDVVRVRDRHSCRMGNRLFGLMLLRDFVRSRDMG